MDRLKSILVAVDFSPCSADAFKQAARIAAWDRGRGGGYGHAIVAFVKGEGFDLAVLGTRAKWNLRDFFWGTTAERVVGAGAGDGEVSRTVILISARSAWLVDYDNGPSVCRGRRCFLFSCRSTKTYAARRSA